MRVQLSTTDYGDFLANDAKLDPCTIRLRLRDRLVAHFLYLKENAVGSGSLRRLLEWIEYGYMIDNVVLLMAGTAAGREEVGAERAEELIQQCHPLGRFDALPGLTAGGWSGEEVRALILAESPIGRFFKSVSDLEEHYELTRAKAWRTYLAEFAALCRKCFDQVSASLMCDMLEAEADRRTLSIAVNSLGSSTVKSRDDRMALFPQIGAIYSQGIADRLAKADDIAAIRAVVDAHPALSARFSAGLDPDSALPRPDLTQTSKLEQTIALEEVNDCKSAFEYPANIAVFYAWIRLKEQELRNVVWIAECIAQQQKKNVDEYIPLW
jgi:V-type H+-transporting ATPase subunit d